MKHSKSEISVNFLPSLLHSSRSLALNTPGHSRPERPAASPPSPPCVVSRRRRPDQESRRRPKYSYILPLNSTKPVQKAVSGSNLYL
ncbi:hypothetical protein L484_023059 [Morus notabilis]|uniref:Uncharacterized protein n=1 Tax=Morus notabilis TaxID=981085 RepID=W9RL13_9ROSA|nr:hypothetical protein L484_023059 [Morus notabilis]